MPPLHALASAIFVGNVGDGWFVATEKSDYIQAIGLSSAKLGIESTREPISLSRI